MAKLRKLITVVLVFTMLLSMVNLTALAAEGEGEPICGLEEHQHDPSCYELPDGSIEAEPICGKPEHTHTDDCYAPVEAEPEVTEEQPQDDYGFATIASSPSIVGSPGWVYPNHQLEQIGASDSVYVGEDGTYYYCPVQEYTCANWQCNAVVVTLIPERYALVSDRSLTGNGYYIKDTSVVSKNASFKIERYPGYNYPCLTFQYTAIKPGTTGINLGLYHNFDYFGETGYCDSCGTYQSVASNSEWWQRIVGLDITVNAAYVLKYDANGGKNGPASTTVTKADTTAQVTVTSGVPTRDGYKFLGWADRPEATQAQYQAGNQITLEWSDGYGSRSNPVSKTLYAVWGDDTPTTPAPPKTSELDGIFSKAMVTVMCVTPNEANPNHKSVTYTTWSNGDANYQISEVTKSGDTYTCTVTLNSAGYVDRYSRLSDNAGVGKHHDLAPGEPATHVVTLTYDAATKKWTAPANWTPIVIKAVCGPVDPPEPTGEVTNFTKERLTSAPDGITVSGDVNYEATPVIPYDGSVTLLYAITVTGTPGTNYTVTDGSATYVGGDPMSGTIPEDGSAVIYVTKTFTQSDVENGMVSNTASVTPGTGDNSSSSHTAQTTVTTEAEPEAPIVVKTLDDANKTYKPGDTVTWTITITNHNSEPMTVNVTDSISGVTLSGDGFDTETGTITVPANSSVTLKASYTLTETDRTVPENTATATDTETNKSGDGTCTTTPEVQAREPKLEVTKTVTSTPANGTAYAAGDTITYEITVRNNGNVTVTGITVTDPLTGNIDNNVWRIQSLAPGASQTFTATYTVKDTDVGTLTNIATASGYDDRQTPVTGSNVPVETDVYPAAPTSIDGYVTVNCINEAPNIGHESRTYEGEDIDPESVIFGAVAKDEYGGYFITVTITAQSYVEKYSDEFEQHYIPESGVSSQTSRVYYGEDGWGIFQASFDVNCDAEAVPDLNVTKVRTSTTSNVGDTLTWNISITNNTDEPKEVTVTDSILDNIPVTLSYGEQSGEGSLEVTVPSHDSITVTASYTIQASDAGETIRNSVTVNNPSDSSDPNNGPKDYTAEEETPSTVPYTVTFDPNQGTLQGSNTRTVAPGETVGAGNMPVPTRPGYNFQGWFTADGVPFTGDTEVNSDVTVEARWTEVTPPTPAGPGPVTPEPEEPDPDQPDPDEPVEEIPDEPEPPLSEDPDTPDEPDEPDEPIEEIPDEPEPPLSEEPDTPDEPDEPDEPIEDIEDPDVPLDEVPKTGDETQMALWAALLMLSGLGLVALNVKSRKKEDR